MSAPAPSATTAAVDPRRRAHYTVTANDLANAYRLQAMANFWRWRTLLRLGIAVVVMMGLLTALITPAPPPLMIAFGCGCAIVGALILGRVMIAVVIPERARRIYRQQRGLHGDVSVSWDDAAFRVRVAESSTVTPWPHYIRWCEDKTVLLLCHSDALFQFIPKSAMDTEQIDDLRKCAAAEKVEGAARAIIRGR